ncbi:MAG: phosphoglucosamine mutase, partial [Bacillota bacterium]
GYKLPDDLEEVVERAVEEMDGEDRLPRPTGAGVGRVRFEPWWKEQYLGFLAGRVGVRLDGLKVVLDCANGAAFEVGPELFRRLGAEVVAINTGNSGEDINVACGSTHPERVAVATRQAGADAGLAFDGDADRCIAVDELGNVVDGDQILAICALQRLKEGTLAGGRVAVTVYSNGGLRAALRSAGGDVVVTAPGDRHVLQAMLKNGLVLGGEQSGHVIFLDHARTGDGVLTGLMLLDVMKRTGRRLSDLAAQMPRFPQALVNVRVARKEGLLDLPEVQEAIRQAQAAVGELGRVYVRPSGTEPVIRVMVEASDRSLVEQCAHQVAEALRRAGQEQDAARDPEGVEMAR